MGRRYAVDCSSKTSVPVPAVLFPLLISVRCVVHFVQGAILAVVKASNLTAVLNSSYFDINNPSAAIAQSEIDRMTAFLNSSAAMDSSNYIVGAGATNTRYRKLVYEYDNHMSWGRDVEMHATSTGSYIYMNTDASYVNKYNITWAGAYQYCQDRGLYLCDQLDYVYTTLYRPAANNTNLAVVFGTVQVPVGQRHACPLSLVPIVVVTLLLVWCGAGLWLGAVLPARPPRLLG